MSEQCPVTEGRIDAGRARRPIPHNCPVNDYDPYDDAALLDPYDHYSRLRAQGGVVYLSRYGLFALPRYDTVKAALADWKTFSSAAGVMLNDVMNSAIKGTLLCSDPPEHDVLRSVIQRPLTPPALREVRDEITAEAEGLADRLCAKGRFDAATELAQYLPLKIVATRVGLPPVGQQRMLSWSTAGFDTAGPIEKERTRAGFATLEDWGKFIAENGGRHQVPPDSWLGGLYRAADEGLIPEEKCRSMAIDYTGPSLDTTISATASAIYLFARHPDQWDRLRAEPRMIPNAINEVVRYESPVQGWSRYVTSDVTLDGVVIPAGSRVLVMFGSANRDERKWENPAVFDVTRRAADHLGFGHGEHICAGANLARMEIAALLTALAKRVSRFELEAEPERYINNVARAWTRIPVRALA